MTLFRLFGTTSFRGKHWIGTLLTVVLVTHTVWGNEPKHDEPSHGEPVQGEPGSAAEETTNEPPHSIEGAANPAAKSPSPHPSEHEGPPPFPTGMGETNTSSASPALSASENLFPRKMTEEEADFQEFQVRLDDGLRQKRERKFPEAENTFVALLQTTAPPAIQRKALLEIGILAQEQRQFTRAQQIFSQYLSKFRDDPSVPEVLLLQALVYREMGAHTLAISRFFAVMSTALHLPQGRTDYYERLVLRAQTEIAETYYLKGDFAEATDYLSRLLKLNDRQLNRAQIRYKLIRALSQQARPVDVVSQASLFIGDHSLAREIPEVRFLLATALKRLARNREATEQVLALLQPSIHEAEEPTEGWAQWRQRAGNEIGNQLYEEGDYFNALEIYLKLVNLNANSSWQIPVLYQIGLINERLEQPAKASDTYEKIGALAKKMESGNLTPALSAVIDMAQWRSDNLSWQLKAAQASGQLRSATPLKVAQSSQ